MHTRQSAKCSDIGCQRKEILDPFSRQRCHEPNIDVYLHPAQGSHISMDHSQNHLGVDTCCPKTGNSTDFILSLVQQFTGRTVISAAF
jgi:hypothetical protein